MPVDLFHPLTNPITKETSRTLSMSEEVYVFEWIVAPGGYVPFEHIHLVQDEIFRVEAGEVKLVIDGKEFIGKPGEVITAPGGNRHNETTTLLVKFFESIIKQTFTQWRSPCVFSSKPSHPRKAATR